MVDKKQAPTAKDRFLELAERLGIALCVRALWELIDQLLDHRGILSLNSKASGMVSPYTPGAL
jgi:hypothetical protein